MSLIENLTRRLIEAETRLALAGEKLHPGAADDLVRRAQRELVVGEDGALRDPASGLFLGARAWVDARRADSQHLWAAADGKPPANAGNLKVIDRSDDQAFLDNLDGIREGEVVAR